MLHKSFKPAKCKTALNLAKSRIKLMKNKKDIQVKQLKRELAQLLESGQDQTARIRVEHVVREEKTMAAYEMIEIYCELIVARLPIIESQKNCPFDLKEAITSLIFAAPRCGDIPELQDVRKHFTAKYGKEFVTAAIELRPECGVSRTLVEKLSVKAPDGPTKVKILTSIAEEHNIRWEPNWFKEENPVASIDTPKVTHTEKVRKIQMEPLNFQIADDLEEESARDPARSEITSQSHACANINEVPPSFASHSDSRPSGSSSERMVFSQSYGTAENAFPAGKQNWNIEFKDAAAAARAAAESAELASIAARAAAELSSHSNNMSDYSSGAGLSSVHVQSEGNNHYVGSILQRRHVQKHSTNSSLNQRNPRIQDQDDANEHGHTIEGADARSLNIDYSHSGLQYETKRQDYTETENSPFSVNCDSRRQSRDSVSTLSTSKAESSVIESSNFQGYDNEAVENHFREKTVQKKNHPSSFQSKSSGFGDGHGIMSNLNYHGHKNDSEDGSFGGFSQDNHDKEDWYVGTTHLSSSNYGKEDRTFKDDGGRNELDEKKYGFDSGSDIYVGMGHRSSSMDIDEKGTNSDAAVIFDESGSDNDECFFNPADKYNFPSPGKSSPKHSSLRLDNPHYEPDLSESFRRSSLYSKLIEPLPVTYDDSDGESSGSEKELKREKNDPGVLSYNYRKLDIDPQASTEFVRSSYVEKGTADSFASSKHAKENQSTYSDSVSKHKSSFSDSDAIDPPYNHESSIAESTSLVAPSNHSLVDEGKPQKSPQPSRLPLESRHLGSDFEYETQSSVEGGMELNLGSLAGGRRNRPYWRSPYTRGGLTDASSPSRSSHAAPSDSFGSSEKTFTPKSPVSSSQMDDKQVFTKMNRARMHFNSPDDDSEVVIAPKGSTNTERPYDATMHENMHTTSPKDPTGYFDSDDSSSEDVPKPVVSRTFLGTGLSRRTRASAPRPVASSQSSAITDFTSKRGHSPSSSYATEVFPKLQTKTIGSGSRSTGQSSWDDETTSGQRSDVKVSKEDKSLSSSVAEEPTIPKGAENTGESVSSEKAPRENSIKRPGYVHPKLPDFEALTAHLQSLKKNRE